MRPKIVARAELIYLASVGAFLATGALTWNVTAAQVGVSVALTLMAGVAIVSVLLLLLTTRRGSRLALVFLTLVSVLTIVGMVIQVLADSLPAGLVGILTWAQAMLVLVANFMLLGGAARQWYVAKQGDPA